MTRCEQCRRELSLTRLRCPRCARWNDAHPLIIIGKVLAVGTLTLAVWFIVRLATGVGDGAARPIEVKPEQEPPFFRRTDSPSEPSPLDLRLR